MLRQTVVCIIVIVAVITVQVTPEIVSVCSLLLSNCTEEYNKAIAADDKNWNIVLQYTACVDQVDCPDDVDAMAQKDALTEEIQIKVWGYWGREWSRSELDSGPSLISSTVTLLSTLIAVLIYSML